MPEPNQLSTPPARARSPLRYAMPFVLFLVIIGGIAWLVQNMPSWRTRTNPVAQGKAAEQVLQFMNRINQNYVLALWELPPKMGEKSKAEDGSEGPMIYEREFEPGAEGRYLFPFQNLTDQAAELGLTSTSCDCAHLHVALITKSEWDQFEQAFSKDPGQEMPQNADWTWTEMEKNADRGFSLPPQAYGVVRMTWHNRRAIGDKLNLQAVVWAKQAGSSRVQRVAFAIPAVSAPPVRANLDRVHVGNLDPNAVVKAEFFIWSPTRDELPLDWTKNQDPLFVVSAKALDPAGRLALQEQLRTAKNKVNTRVRAGYRVTINVHEHKDGKRLDQGHFIRGVPLSLPESAADVPPLLVTGFVRGPVEIGGIDDQGKINLKSFQAKDGTKKTILLWTDNKTSLKVVEKQPAALEVKLTQRKSASKREWVLEVTVPPNQLFGTITEDSAVILGTIPEGTQSVPSRQIRIPLVGHAVQG